MKNYIFFFIFFLITTTLFSKEKIYKIGAIIYAKPFMISLKGFQDGLKKLGYKENIKYYIYNINTDLKKIPHILNKLNKLKVNLIFATTTPVNLAIKTLQKSKIPVIFNEVADPVGCGLVKSLLKPNCNFTGITHAAIELLPKRLEIFKNMFPTLKKCYVFINPLEKFLNSQLKYLMLPAKILKLKIIPLYVSTRSEIEKIVNKLKLNSKTDGIFMSASALPMANVDLLINFSRINKIPLMVIDNVILPKGGCVGYSPNFYDVGFQSANLADKILKGISPKNIPVEYPEKISLVVSLKEIKRLNLKFNKNFLVYANKIIK